MKKAEKTEESIGLEASNIRKGDVLESTKPLVEVPNPEGLPVLATYGPSSLKSIPELQKLVVVDVRRATVKETRLLIPIVLYEGRMCMLSLACNSLRKIDETND